MTDDNNATPEETEDEQEITPIEAAPRLDIDNADIETLKQQIKALNRESMTRRKAESDRQKAQRVKDQKALDTQGEYKKLSDDLMSEVLELRPIKEEYEAGLEYDSQRNAERIEAIPESMRSIVPADYSPRKLKAWLDANASKLTQQTAPDINAGAGGGSSSRAKPIQLTEEIKTMAKLANMTEKDYVKQLTRK